MPPEKPTSKSSVLPFPPPKLATDQEVDLAQALLRLLRERHPDLRETESLMYSLGIVLGVVIAKAPTGEQVPYFGVAMFQLVVQLLGTAGLLHSPAEEDK